MSTPKMTAVPQPILFSLGGKDYYLVKFTRGNLEESFSHREVKECLRASGHTPADVDIEKDDKILYRNTLQAYNGWIGLFGKFSHRHEDKEKVAFFDPRANRFWRYHQDAGNGNLPHPVLCCK